MTTNLINEREMEKLYDGPLTGPFSYINDYLFDQEQINYAKNIAKDVILPGYSGPGISTPTQEYVDLSYLGYKKNINGLVAYHLNKPKNNLSVYFLGNKRTKKKFIKGLTQSYEDKIRKEAEREITRSRRNLESQLKDSKMKNKKFDLFAWFRK